MLVNIRKRSRGHDRPLHALCRPRPLASTVLWCGKHRSDRGTAAGKTLTKEPESARIGDSADPKGVDPFRTLNFLYNVERTALQSASVDARALKDRMPEALIPHVIC